MWLSELKCPTQSCYILNGGFLHFSIHQGELSDSEIKETHYTDLERKITRSRFTIMDTLPNTTSLHDVMPCYNLSARSKYQELNCSPWKYPDSKLSTGFQIIYFFMRIFRMILKKRYKISMVCNTIFWLFSMSLYSPS